MKTQKYEKGQAIIMIVFAIIGLIALTGLAVDGGIGYVDRREDQVAADAAAWAGALAKIRGEDIEQAAWFIAAANGMDEDDSVAVHNPPISGPYAGNSEYIQVIITSNVPTTFGSIVGISKITNVVEAVSRAKPGSSSQSGGGLFGGAGIVALSLTDLDYSMGGSGLLINHGGGVFSNSSRAPSVVLSGNPRICLDPGYSVGVVPASGGATICAWCSGGCPAGSATGLPKVTNSAPQYTQSQIDAMLAAIPARPEPPSCPSGVAGTITGASCWDSSCTPQSVSAGDYPAGLTLDGGKYFTMASGTYCFTGSKGFTSGGGARFVHNPDTTDLVFVAKGANGVDMAGGSDNYRLRSLQIYTENGAWHVGGGVNLYTDKLRFISSGTGNMVIDGNTSVQSLAGGQVSDTFLYFTAGKPSWDAGAALKLHAPSSGDFKGLLVYLPWSNTSALTFAGGTSYSLTGTYMAPHSFITISGGSDTAVVNSQIVGYRFVIDGGAKLNLNYGAADNYGGAITTTAPAIELVK